ncbi:MAG: hypothetical protein IT338_06900 [Thermomicrobiales bacterium]|nr:hypothetical protein [Thermomicrobiales bacterium]
MKYLWIVTLVMLGLGVALIAAGMAGTLGPIALVAGVLLVWSAIVKVIVLRIWRSTLFAPATAQEARALASDGRRLGRAG